MDGVATSSVNVELYLNGDLIGSATNAQFSFDGLNSNTNYVFKASFTYDLNDGAGEQTCIIENEIKTDAKAIPEIKLNMDSDAESVRGAWELIDVDGVATSSVNVEIYLDGGLVGSTSDVGFSFDGLDSYTDYVVKANIDYDLSDGTGRHTHTVEKKISTKPYIDVVSISVLNTSGVAEGDKLYVKVIIDNPDEVDINSVTINGIECDIIGGSTPTILNVQILNDGQFGAGNVKLRVEAINTVGYTYKEADEVSDEAFIHRSITFERIQFVNSDYEPVNWRFPDETIYAMITIDNPAGYEILSVTLYDEGMNNTYVYSSPIKIDDNTYCFPYDGETAGGFTKVKSIQYEDSQNPDGAPMRYNVDSNSDLGAAIVTLHSSDIQYISTPADLDKLLNSIGFGSHMYYQLTCDIDMTGIDWTPMSNFSGVLDGNGYTISNINIVGASNRGVNGLLFDTLWGGAVINLNIASCNMIIDYNGDGETQCGMIAGTSFRGLIYNCTVDANSSIVVQCNLTGPDVGGIVGYVHETGQVIECTNYGSVSASTMVDYDFVGGIAGSSRGQIINCTNYGSVTAGYNAGGIVSQTYGGIEGCINYGTVRGGSSVDGICAFDYFSRIKNCENYGRVELIE